MSGDLAIRPCTLTRDTFEKTYWIADFMILTNYLENGGENCSLLEVNIRISERVFLLRIILEIENLGKKRSLTKILEFCKGFML